MSPRTVRVWSRIHSWTSLACTLFALMLCVTGLPLIFQEELRPHPELLVRSHGPAPSIQSLVDRALAARPGEVMPYLYFDAEEPLLKVPTAPLLTSDPAQFHYQVFDMRSGERIDVPQPNEGWVYVMRRLHADLFAGLYGMYFLGTMGLLLFAALVSGIVLYGPFTRSIPFGTVRDKSRKLRWLDLHNLLGIGTAGWLAIVSFTGIINTLAMPVEMAWQSSQLVEMAARGGDGTVASADRRAPIDTIVAAVRTAEPDMAVTTLAFPGTPFTSGNNVAVFLTGDTLLTSRILKPALVDAGTGRIVAITDMPWYAQVLFMSQPLHFGDYGGLPLKILWAVLDLAAIVILASGVYLWIARRWRPAARAPVEPRRGTKAQRARLTPARQWMLPTALAAVTTAGLGLALALGAPFGFLAWTSLALIVVTMTAAFVRHRVNRAGDRS